MHCLYLNTDRRTDRRDWMEEHLSSLGWSYERFPCLKNEDDSKGFMNIGLRSCWLTHEAALERALQNPGLTLILEDDAKVLNKERVEFIIANLIANPDWDCQYFYGTSGGRSRICNLFRCHAYIANPEFIPTCLAILRKHRAEIEQWQPKDGQTFIDSHFRWMQKRYRFWGTEELIIQDRDRFGSDMGWGFNGSPKILN